MSRAKFVNSAERLMRLSTDWRTSAGREGKGRVSALKTIDSRLLLVLYLPRLKYHTYKLGEQPAETGAEKTKDFSGLTLIT